MANDKKKCCADDAKKPVVADVMREIKVVNHKLNLLLENAGLGEQLRALTEQLRGPTDQLEATVKANQP